MTSQTILKRQRLSSRKREALSGTHVSTRASRGMGPGSPLRSGRDDNSGSCWIEADAHAMRGPLSPAFAEYDAPAKRSRKKAA